MKNLNTVLILIITLSSVGLFAQTKKINSKKSTIHWLGKKIGGKHEGYIQLKSGTLEEKEGEIVAGSFTVDMSSITNTDLTNKQFNAKLVDHLKSADFFGVEKFPTAKFVITKASKFSNNKATITGKLTIKGTTVSKTFDILKEGNKYMTKIEVDRSKYDIKYGSSSFFDSLGDKAIADTFTLDIQLIAE